VVQARCSEKVENLGFGNGGDGRPFQGDRQVGTIKVSVAACKNKPFGSQKHLFSAQIILQK
jgi:hypothetical protein